MDILEKQNADKLCRENKTSNDDNIENINPDEDRKKMIILKTEMITLK